MSKVSHPSPGVTRHTSPNTKVFGDGGTVDKDYKGNEQIAEVHHKTDGTSKEYQVRDGFFGNSAGKPK